MRVFLRQMLVICSKVIMIRHDSDTTRVAVMKNLSILDLILHILKPKTNFNLKNIYNLIPLLTSLVLYNDRNRSSIDRRKSSLTVLINSESVERDSRLVIRVVITDITIDNVGDELQANFLVAASKGSNTF